jgi:hypothetical protein
VTTQLVVPSVTVSVDGATGAVPPAGGLVSLNSGRVPYAYATVTLPLTPETLLDSLDPRDDHRVLINGANTGHWEPIIEVGYGYGHGPYGHGPYGGN